MKISNNTLKKLVWGVVDFYEDKGYLGFNRFSEKQLEYFKALPQNYQYWYDIATYSCGVNINLKSDATKLCFDYRLPTPRGNNTVDLYIDGMLHSVYNLNSPKGKVEFDMPNGKKTLKIYMPIDCPIEVKNFEFNGSYSSVKQSGKKVLFLGDSITQGFGTHVASLCFSLTVARELGYNHLQQGVGGFRYEGGVVEKTGDFTPDGIIVALGINYHDNMSYDYEKAIDEFYENLDKHFKGVPVVVITPIKRIGPPANPVRLAALVEYLLNTVKKYPNVKVIDGQALVPEVKEFFLPDGVHPSTAGYMMYAKNLIPELKKIKF